jgi:glycosyltransferase involved in cell wall biosynthesis
MPERTLFLLSAPLEGSAREAEAAGDWPRKEYFDVAAALDADVIDYEAVEGDPIGRLLRRLIGMPMAQAVLAFRRRDRYDRILCDGEHIAIPLALLLRLSRRAPRLLAITHMLTTPNKRAVFRWLRPQRQFAAITVHSSRQAELACRSLGFSTGQVTPIPWLADTSFWRPAASVSDEAMICTAGLEYRDYPTFLRAVADMPLRVVVAAGSRWSHHRNNAEEPPPNVEVTSLDYPALRDLYARARFVVVPLREVDNQAGITVILEAMAMGKAVIVSATRGQRDVIRGQLCTRDGVGGEPLGGPAAFGISGELAMAETGLYVPPGDAPALRRAIQYLLDHPDEASRMGAAGRRLVSETMTVSHFVQRLTDVVEDSGQSAVRAPRRRPSAITWTAAPPVANAGGD